MGRNRSRRVRSPGWAFILPAVISAMAMAADAPAPLKTGVRLRQELQRPINIFRQNVPAREMAEQLTTLHGIAILLDRRIDPDRLIDVQLTQVTLREGLDLFAGQLDADAAVIGGTVVIGPSESLDRMRTDIARQRQLLREIEGDDARQRTFDLFLGLSFHWDDLQHPSELLHAIAERFHLEVEDLSLIPHDLWAGGTLSDVNAVEALEIVAGQFDLTLVWNDDLSAVRLAPSPARLTIEQFHRLGSRTKESVMDAIKNEYPLAEIEATDRTLRIVATVGEHEQIAGLLNPEQQDAPAPVQGPLEKRIFTLTTQPVAAIVVLRTLETQDVIVEYDPEVLQAAGIDLSQKVTLKLREASADEFFHALCDPLGVAFELDGKTVRLIPKM